MLWSKKRSYPSKGERHAIQLRPAASGGAGEGVMAHQSGDHGAARGGGDERERGGRAGCATDARPCLGRTAEETAGVRRRRTGTDREGWSIARRRPIRPSGGGGGVGLAEQRREGA